MPSGGFAGGTTTVTDNNNPYSNALARNAESSYGFTMPFLQAQISGQKTPFSDLNNMTSQMTAKHFAGKYGQPIGDANLQESFMKGQEGLTMPNESAMGQLMQMYGAGAPSQGGTTSVSKQNLGALDYAQVAALVAALAGK